MAPLSYSTGQQAASLKKGLLRYKTCLESFPIKSYEVSKLFDDVTTSHYMHAELKKLLILDPRL